MNDWKAEVHLLLWAEGRLEAKKLNGAEKPD
jgi:hypothetical protein